MIGPHDMTLSGLKPREEVTHGVPCNSILDPRADVAQHTVPAHVLRILDDLFRSCLTASAACGQSCLRSTWGPRPIPSIPRPL